MQAVRCITLASAAAVIVLSLSPICVAQPLPHLDTTGRGKSGSLPACDECNSEVALNTSFPFGDYCHSTAYVGVNGIISFGEEFDTLPPVLLPGTAGATYYSYVAAPFWADADLRVRGNISWEVHSLGASIEGDSYLNQVSEFLRNRENVTFLGDWMMVVSYDRVPIYDVFAIFYPDIHLPHNTYQAILITDGSKSYAVYTYTCDQMEWGNKAVIGYNAAGTYFANHPLSGTDTVARIGCQALPQLVNNVVYDLVPDPSSLQCSSSTPLPPTSLGSCREAGYETCCEGDMCLGEPQDCFCDQTCHIFLDCCRDIDNICPQETFPENDGNKTYLLFANAYHINRVSLDGFSFEILYSDGSSGGIVGLDYHHSQGYMYWSDINYGTLNRAHLNGSDAEILHHTADFLIDDIAVDWVNDKLYWTEGTLGSIAVLDIELRTTKLLIDNGRDSTTRAIAVDPTAGYMYWTDWGTRARIERAGMDGSNRIVLHDTNLVWPNGLTLDYVQRKVYWIDANLDTIEYCNMDGSGRVMLQKRDNNLFHPFSLTLEKELLYWSEWSSKTIFSTHKDLVQDNVVAIQFDLVFPPHGIEAVTPDRQPDVANPCSEASCSHLCLLSPNAVGYSCVCSDEDTECGGTLTPTPTPTPTPPSPSYGSCGFAGYTGCCTVGSCYGVDINTGGSANCTCDAQCRQLGTCCVDIQGTCPDFSGSVLDVQVVNISSSQLRIDWSPPVFGNRVQYYRVTVRTIKDTVNITETESTFVIIEGLLPKVPYYLLVEAVSAVGYVESESAIAFTQQGTPSGAPDVSISWASLSELQVSWELLSLEEARGFVVSYVVTYSDGGGRKKRATDTESVPGNQSIVTLSGLDSEKEYTVSVAAQTVAGVGVSSNPQSAPSAGVIFQLHFIDVPSCKEWRDEEKVKVSQILTKLVAHVNDFCSLNCNFQASDVSNAVLQCYEDPNSLTFRALLLRSSMSRSRDILSAIKEWVEQGQSVSLGDAVVKLNPSCKVTIESYEEESCDSPSSSESSGSSPATIIVPIIIIFIVLIAITILVVVLVLFMRHRKQNERLYLNFDEPEVVGTARLSPTLYEPEEGERELDNPIYDEKKVLEEESIDEKISVGEYFEDPTVLK